jgi:hypothetical protein
LYFSPQYNYKYKFKENVVDWTYGTNGGEEESI